MVSGQRIVPVKLGSFGAPPARACLIIWKRFIIVSTCDSLLVIMTVRGIKLHLVITYRRIIIPHGSIISSTTTTQHGKAQPENQKKWKNTHELLPFFISIINMLQLLNNKDHHQLFSASTEVRITIFSALVQRFIRRRKSLECESERKPRGMSR